MIPVSELKQIGLDNLVKIRLVATDWDHSIKHYPDRRKTRRAIRVACNLMNSNPRPHYWCKSIDGHGATLFVLQFKESIKQGKAKYLPMHSMGRYTRFGGSWLWSIDKRIERIAYLKQFIRDLDHAIDNETGESLNQQLVAKHFATKELEELQGSSNG